RFLEFMNQVPVEHKTILISSFYLPPIRFIQKNSSLKTAFILNNSMTSFFIKIYLLLTGWGADYLHIRSDMSVKFWKKFKRFKGIQVYTVNTIEEAEKLKLLGADGIFTDRADEMMNLTTLMTDV
ncbi:MAG: hypothetical protein KAI81_03350, partial [Candidatus Marinimicrobia bacterium]|nr:hypothetical protein [Candidatus Neomarinimicrobiota bacterium]